MGWWSVAGAFGEIAASGPAGCALILDPTPPRIRLLPFCLLRFAEGRELLESQAAVAAQVADTGTLRRDFADLGRMGTGMVADVKHVVGGHVPDPEIIRTVRLGQDWAGGQDQA